MPKMVTKALFFNKIPNKMQTITPKMGIIVISIPVKTIRNLKLIFLREK